MPSLLKFLIDNDFDVIHSHEFFGPCSIYSTLASRLKNTPLVITQHSYQSPEKISSKLLYYANAFTAGKIAFEQADTITALTKSIETHLISLGAKKKKITIIPNGIDTERFNSNNKNYLKEKFGISQQVVLFVGRFIEWKGIQYLLEAFTDVIKKVPDAKLVMVGTGPQLKEINKFREKYVGSVFLLNFINHEEMPYIYTGCDVFVLPSLFEIFGNVVLEAMASGKPVIGSDVGGMKEIIVHGKTGFRVQPKNSKQLSEYIIKVLTDESLKNRLGINARLRATETYSTEVVCNKIEEIYFKAISKLVHNRSIY